MINQKVELIEDCYPFKKGSVFIVTSEDDGMWSRNPFVAGYLVDQHGRKRRISCEPKHVKYTDKGEGGISYEFEMSQEEIDDYMNPLNHP
jgi:hypothetical protein